MESRLAAAARANFRLISGVSRHQSLRRGLATGPLPLPTRRVADPAIHSEDPSESDTLVTARAAATAEKKSETEHKPTKELDPLVPPKPPYSPSLKLESPAVTQPVDPILQQKRHRHTTVTNNRAAAIGDVSCAALDDGPWPDDREESRRQLGREEEEEEDYKEYYGHNKASPLSEIEFADTRKPITRATDGTADSYVGDYSEHVILWREEQLDTAEEALRRAMEIWKQSATRGDPDSPHGRVLRALRGENW